MTEKYCIQWIDEVLAISEKVVIRVDDLLTWITQATDWHWGLNAIWERDCVGQPQPPATPTIDMDDIAKEKLTLDESHWETNTGVVVLSYPRYCRYRGIIKRVEGVEDKWLRTSLVIALGGLTAPCKNTRILFCKDTFDYPDLEGHELLCNHLAPKLKGRPRKRKKASMSPDGSDSESESSHSNSSTTSKLKPTPPQVPKVGLVKPRLRCTLEVNKRPARGPTSEEKSFLTTLYNFMRERRTPITKIPIVGFKEVNLYKLYKKVRELGGYDMVTAGKLWKFVYEVMGGDMTSTSAATLSRRHYERLLLPYERHVNGVRTSPKIKPTLTLPPVPLPRNSHSQVSNINNSNSNSNNKNKHNNVISSKNRLKQDKVSIEKENIPQRREISSKQVVNKTETTKQQVSKQQQQQQQQQVAKQTQQQQQPQLQQQQPQQQQKTSKPVKVDSEVIDLSEDSPLKLCGHPQARAMSPMFKKQKLEILKEGGLEVTPVGTGRVSVIKQTVAQPLPPTKLPTILPMVSVPPPRQSLPPPPISMQPKLPILPNVGNKISITVTPDIDMSHLTAPGPSKKPIYGNPKEQFLTQRSQQAEVLDLRTTKQKLNFGSNLEITLVEAPTPVLQPPPPPVLPPPTIKPVNIPVIPRRQPPQPTNHYRHQPAAAVILPYTPQPNPTVNASPVPARTAYPTFKPFIPTVVDPLYLSAIYGGMLSASGSNFRQPTPPEHIYKELIRRHGIFPAFVHDGTTSITLATPTSK
ncbi:hypothetical protein O3M35_006449 [Rhynocoris fuscipes]|uniref:ARID domain-containing protein n=1 Tax=Rhynocoris fuscipes TaxID=488301 RepID=A0AAW1DJD5_9HEMI